MSERIRAIAIITLLALAFSPNAQATLLLSESFSGWGTWATSPPTNWHINYTGSASTNDWYNGSWHWGWTNLLETDEGVPTLFWDPAESGVDEIISPVIDCSSYSAVWIAFDHSYDHYNGPYSAKVLGSTNGGGTWPHEIWSYNQISYGGFEGKRDSFDISPWAAGQSQVAIKWRGDGNVANINVWNFDNVAVHGFTDPPPGFDLHISRVIRPAVREKGDTSLNPTCIIYNNADSISYPYIRCRIKDFHTQQTIYEDIAEDHQLDPGCTVVDIFRTFNLEENMKYEIFVLVEHPDDVDAENNMMTRYSCTSCDEVNPISVNAPDSGQSGPFNPSAIFKEGTGADWACAAFFCKIETMGQEIVYLQAALQEHFGPNQQKPITFPLASLGSEDTYEITFWATDREGENISNPELVDTFNYTSGVVETPSTSNIDVKVNNRKINLTLTRSTQLDVRLYDVAGKLVTILASGRYNEGFYTFNPDVGSGIYFIRITTGGGNAFEKYIVLK
ncbi:T9SS type A sorting domain-containing protein [candidate division WOR-3 bacterium]|nr:T9SS type A sorting domain-containing protein [candidate division WOR-3 bacterium]